MRYGLLFFASLIALASFLFIGGRPAEASFHCMRIDAIMAGFNGNNSIQYVELRQRAGFNNLVGGHKIRFYDASNTLKATFTFPTPNPTNASSGDSILVGTAEFNANTNGGDADFTFSLANTVASNGGDALHPVQSPGGKIVYAGEAGDFNCTLGAPPSDSVAYGSFSGPVDFGTPAPALPSPSDNRALRVNNLNAPTNNSTEYALAAVATSTFAVSMANLPSEMNTPRNNTRTVLQLAVPVAVGGIARLPGLTVSPAQASHSPGGAGWLTAEISAAAAGALALGSAAWYVRKRRTRRTI